MTATRTTTATDLMAAIAAPGLHVQWDRTGGKARATNVAARVVTGRVGDRWAVRMRSTFAHGTDKRVTMGGHPLESKLI